MVDQVFRELMECAPYPITVTPIVDLWEKREALEHAGKVGVGMLP